MKTSTILRRFILGSGLALTVAGMAVTTVGAQQGGGNVSTPGQTSIATDKDTYIIGEPITITYKLPSPGRIRITDHQAGGKVSTLRAGYTNQLTGRIQGTVTPPVGKECLKLEHTDSRNVKTTAETCFEVKDKEPKQDEPKQDEPKKDVPAPGLYTLVNAAAGAALDSNVERDVYSLPPNGGSFQKWVLEAIPDGFFRVRNLATSLYLDSNPDGDVYTLGNNGGSYQHWKAEPSEGGHFVLRNRATGRVLGNTDGTIFTGDVPGAAAGAPYLWKLTAVQP